MLAVMEFGNKPSDGGHLLLSRDELVSLGLDSSQEKKFTRRIFGADDFINGGTRFCIWIENCYSDEALSIDSLRSRVEAVRRVRMASRDKGANALSKRAHQLKLMRIGKHSCIVVPSVTSERRQYLPAGLIDCHTTITNRNYGLYDAPLWNFAILVSHLHRVWISTVCARLRTDFSYTNTLGWNTFPVPTLTEKNTSDLTCCGEDILLARESHFPATIADLYDPDNMPENLRRAHERNDEVLERIYIGRRFKNDTERLEKLFDMYARMASSAKDATKKRDKANA